MRDLSNACVYYTINIISQQGNKDIAVLKEGGSIIDSVFQTCARAY